MLFVLGVGGGLYLTLGQPQLAVRTLEGSNARDLNALIGRLSIAVREHPADPRGWTLLGQAYFTAHDPQDAAKAFAQAIGAAKAIGEPAPILLLGLWRGADAGRGRRGDSGGRSRVRAGTRRRSQGHGRALLSGSRGSGTRQRRRRR